MTSFWEGFRSDPRHPGNAAVRASDSDRDVVHALLVEAFADGRITHEEFDERSAATVRAVTLGELPPLVADLLPTSDPAAPQPRGALARPELRAQAVRAYRRDLREAVGGFIVPSLVCLVIWAVVMPGGFFWPAFVMLGTGVHLLQTFIRREDIVEKQMEKLERNRSKALGSAEQPPADGVGGSAPDSGGSGADSPTAAEDDAG